MASESVARAEVFQVANLVSPTTQSIVSRELMRAAGGSVTVFAFDSDQGLSEHSAPFDALVQVISGELKITIGGVAHTVVGGSSIIMPADVPHALQAVSASTMLLTMIRGEG